MDKMFYKLCLFFLFIKIKIHIGFKRFKYTDKFKVYNINVCNQHGFKYTVRNKSVLDAFFKALF
jgi:hypothetical protein